MRTWSPRLGLGQKDIEVGGKFSKSSRGFANLKGKLKGGLDKLQWELLDSIEWHTTNGMMGGEAEFDHLLARHGLTTVEINLVKVAVEKTTRP